MPAHILVLACASLVSARICDVAAGDQPRPCGSSLALGLEGTPCPCDMAVEVASRLFGARCCGLSFRSALSLSFLLSGSLALGGSRTAWRVEKRKIVTFSRHAFHIQPTCRLVKLISRLSHRFPIFDSDLRSFGFHLNFTRSFPNWTKHSKVEDLKYVALLTTCKG